MKDMETASPATQVCWELAQQTRADDVLIVGVGTRHSPSVLDHLVWDSSSSTQLQPRCIHD